MGPLTLHESTALLNASPPAAALKNNANKPSLRLLKKLLRTITRLLKRPYRKPRCRRRFIKKLRLNHALHALKHRSTIPSVNLLKACRPKLRLQIGNLRLVELISLPCYNSAAQTTAPVDDPKTPLSCHISLADPSAPPPPEENITADCEGISTSFPTENSAHTVPEHPPHPPLAPLSPSPNSSLNTNPHFIQAVKSQFVFEYATQMHHRIRFLLSRSNLLLQDRQEYFNNVLRHKENL
ncbi:hypothetical protein PtA15_5A475 [Puccinia triticina]|uniref:Uncharacterized protein n=1 Tax=Puccinia triticina TaxID=208348 RepID=A0ABY7CLN0_9BASI|nr:uncharacterized protein PtA15_5A475 [Puccinia triticina]WAQ84902.1 hypothetical protein PtA15_5A475 [Puccinia triticina]